MHFDGFECESGGASEGRQSGGVAGQPSRVPDEESDIVGIGHKHLPRKADVEKELSKKPFDGPDERGRAQRAPLRDARVCGHQRGAAPPRPPSRTCPRRH